MNDEKSQTDNAILTANAIDLKFADIKLADWGGPKGPIVDYDRWTDDQGREFTLAGDGGSFYQIHCSDPNWAKTASHYDLTVLLAERVRRLANRRGSREEKLGGSQENP